MAPAIRLDGRIIYGQTPVVSMERDHPAIPGLPASLPYGKKIFFGGWSLLQSYCAGGSGLRQSLKG